MSRGPVESYWLHPLDVVKAVVAGEGQDFDRVARVLQVPRGTGTAVSVGCGIGFEAFLLMARGYKTIALDANWSTVHVAQYLWPGPTYVWKDVTEWSPEGRPQVVLCSQALEHFDDMDAALAQMASWAAGAYYIEMPIGMDKNPFHRHHILTVADGQALVDRHFAGAEVLRSSETEATWLCTGPILEADDE